MTGQNRRIVDHQGNVVDLSFLQDQKSGYYGQYRSAGGQKPIRKLRNTTDITQINRLIPEVAELAWIKDPITMSGCRMYQSLVEASGAEIYSPDRATNMAISDLLETSEEYENVFFEFAPLHLAVYGNAWIEHVMNRTRTRIWDFNIANPVTMDFRRQDDGFRGEGSKVVLDNLGREWGYRQEASTDGDPNVYFSRAEMTHLTLIQLRRGDLGVGFPEMLFGDINLKENIEQAITANAYMSGFPKPLIQSGNERHHNNPALEQAAMRLASDLVDDGIDYAVMPDGLVMDKWSVDSMDNVALDYLQMVLKYQASAFAIPLPFLLQSGDDMGQNTMELLMENFALMFRAFQKRLKLDKVVTKVLKFNGMPHENVRVDYGRMSERMFKEESLRLFRMLKTGALDISEPEVKQRIDEIAGVPRPKDPTLEPSRP